MDSLPKLLRNATRGENEYRPSTPPLVFEVEEITSRTFRFNVRDSKKRKREEAKGAFQRSIREYRERNEPDINLVDRFASLWEMARNMQRVREEIEREEFERYWGVRTESEDDRWMVKGVSEKEKE